MVVCKITWRNDVDQATTPTVQSRWHRGHRIAAYQLGEEWTGTMHAPDGTIVGTVNGASAQEIMIRGMAMVDELLRQKAATG